MPEYTHEQYVRFIMIILVSLVISDDFWLLVGPSKTSREFERLLSLSSFC